MNKNENIITPSNWSEVYEALFKDTLNKRIGRYKSRFAYRGLSTKSYSMETSLMQLGGEYNKVESHLLRQFKKYAHRNIDAKNNDWYWLSVAQHYGLPTRLLDWSYSPDVALHFATANTNKYDRDGVVWKVNYKEVHKLLPSKLLKKINQENTWILTDELMDKLFKSLGKMDRKGKKEGDFALFFEPPNLDDRIYNQFAYFSVCSRSDMLFDEWLNYYPHLWQKVIIPKELKWEIRDKLDQNNVSERILFPGMEGLANWLKRYYLPTGSAKKDKK